MSEVFQEPEILSFKITHLLSALPSPTIIFVYVLNNSSEEGSTVRPSPDTSISSSDVAGCDFIALMIRIKLSSL